jgi:bacillithiol biosynthesis cysteine-adding enzyme BshC
LQAPNLEAATRYLVNALFGETGLVIVDGDDRLLKRLFIRHVESELFEQFSFKAVSQTNEKLKSYSVQVNPREINLFYLRDGLRSRIVKEEALFRVLETDFIFTENELRQELLEFPERFSPNVILRPLYQEVILPNLVYIGGAGELAYWLQLKSMFSEADVCFPVLKLRNTALILYRKDFEKMQRLSLEISDLLSSVTDLSKRVAVRSADFPLSLENEKSLLENTFARLEALISKTDKSFAGAVSAQKKKQLNGLEKLEKRLLLAQKRKSADEIARALALRQFIFPYNQFQERILNFAVFYAEFGTAFIETLLQEFEPFRAELTVLIADS